VYSPRWTHRCSGKAGEKYAPHPGVFGWITSVLTMDEDDLFSHVGLDTVALLKVFEFCLELFAPMCIYNLCLLMFGFQKYSIAEIHGQSDMLWGHLSSVYVLSFYALWLLNWHYRDFIRWRHRYLRVLNQNSSSSMGAHGRTIMVESIPEDKRTDEALLAYFQQLFLFPEMVDSAVVSKDIGSIDDLVAERDAVFYYLEDALISLETSEGKSVRPTHSLSKLDKDNIAQALRGEKVDSIDHYTRELARLNALVREKMEDPAGLPALDSGIGFVTFSDSATASMAQQLLLSANEDTFHVSPAPEPRDIYWPNMGTQRLLPVLNVRSTLMQIATFGLLAFWAIPVAFIASFQKIEKLSKYLPFLRPILTNKTLTGYLTGFIPTILLATLMYLLPHILEAMVIFEGRRTYSKIDRVVSKRFLTFQVVNVLLVSCLAGGFMSALQQMIKQPTKIPSLLATSLPNTFFFFVNYVMLLAFSLYPAELMQISPLVSQLAFLRLAGRNERRRRKALKPLPPAYGWPRMYGAALLVMIISMVFSSIAPMILPFTLLFFGIGWFVVRYMAMYVWQGTYESGGQAWGFIVKSIIAGLVIYQLTFIGIFYLKQNLVKGSIAWPLPFFTVAYAYYLKQRYKKSFNTLALDEVRNPQSNELYRAGLREGTVGGEQRSVLQIDSPLYFYALDPEKVETDKSFDLPIAHFFQQPALLKARFDLVVHEDKLLSPDTIVDNEVFDEGPQTLSVQLEPSDIGKDNEVEEGVALVGVQPAPRNSWKRAAAGPEITFDGIEQADLPLPSAMVTIMAFAVAMIAVVAIVVFKMAIPPPSNTGT
jgi:calcium permeable stress-gated cation channel